MDPSQFLFQGIELAMKGRHDDAIAAYRRALELKPDFVEAQCNLGSAMMAKGQIDDAIVCYRHAIRINPNFALAHCNLGSALREKGQTDEAITCFRQAIRLKIDYVLAYNNLGNALREKGQLDEAISSYQQAIRLKADYPESYNHLGNALRDKGQLDDAIAAYHQALRLRPGYPGAYYNLGHVLTDQGQIDDALACYREAIRLNPDFARAHSSLAFCLLYHPDTDMPTLARVLKDWDQRFVEPLRSVRVPHQNDRNPDRPLRVGYVSSDFCDHVCAKFILPLFAHHDKQHVQAFAYADVAKPDHVTEKLKSYTDHWRSTAGLSDDAMADIIRKDQIDILVDLSLHTANHRLLVFAHKPAPVQVSWLGYPGPVGVSTIDYRLADPYLEPIELDDSGFPEKPIRLPDTVWCYDPMTALPPAAAAVPAATNGYITFGCLNNFSKINQPLLKLWSRVLLEVPKSRLILKSPAGSARENVIQTLGGFGIDTHRIEMLNKCPPGEYFSRYERIDICLDTLPYNGHATSLDAMWMGVPVVTRVGKTIVGRGGFSQLSNLGLANLAGHSDDEYVKIAVDLARDLPRLTELHRTLRTRMEQSPLMEAKRFAQAVESAYRNMWRKWTSAS